VPKVLEISCLLFESALVHDVASAAQSLVLENITNAFLKPNILDIKLGTILYGPDANEEKKARMIQRAKDTTSLETGIRLTGFQVFLICCSDLATKCDSQNTGP
jgi:hypothetical protein